MILDTNRSDIATACQGANACTTGNAGSGYPETWITPAADADALYYEQGHVMDFAYATDADRKSFMQIWHLPGTTANWWDRDSMVAGDGGQVPPGEFWSSVYAGCSDPAHDAFGDNLIALYQSCALFSHL